MLFSSLVFLFVFLPLVLLFYYILPKKFRNYELLFFSFIFYAWGEPRAFFVMLAIIFINYVFAIAVEKNHGRINAKRFLLAVCIVLNLGTLFYFKYLDFAVSMVNKVMKNEIPLFHIALPIGISFFIFQALSYTVDVFRNQCGAQKNPLKLALYVSLFPQLIAGPIVKYHDVAGQIDSRSVSLESFYAGVKRFIYGLSKKVLIANSTAYVADSVFSNYELASAGSLWIGILCYSLQIYYDFSGYSDMAIGLGKMFGFDFLENFNYPYISSSITEFWRRWHISLSTWFKEYVYIPLGGNRVSKKRNVFNVFVVFLLTGIWHGAANVFIAWGLWHGILNILEKLTGFNKKSQNGILRFIQHVYTLAAVSIGWVFFRSPSMKSGLSYIMGMFGIGDKVVAYGLWYFISGLSLFWIFIGVILSFPVYKIISAKTDEIKSRNTFASAAVHGVEVLFLLVLFVLCISLLAGSTYNPFIYFRF